MHSSLASLRNPKLPLGHREIRLETYSWAILIAGLAIPLVARFLAFRATDLPSFGAMLDATIGLSGMNGSGLASIAIFYLLARPSKDHLEWTVFSALPLEVAYMVNLPAETSPFDRFLMLGGGVGAAGFLGLMHLAAWGKERTTRRRARLYVRLSLVMLFYPLIAGALLGILSHFNPLVFDAHGYNLEGSLGFFPSFEAVRLQLAFPPLERLASAVYCRLPIWVILAFALCAVYPGRCYFDVFSAFAISGTVVFFFYHSIPMIGMDDFLGRPPWPQGPIPPAAESVLIAAPAVLPRSCMPSMHMCWILIAYFAVQRISKRLLGLYLFLVVCTALSAMGPHVGHYFIDFIPSFPFAVAWMAATAFPKPGSRSWRVVGVVAGNLLTLFYCLCIRWTPGFWSGHPYAWWGLSLALVLGSLWFERRIARACLGEEQPLPLEDSPI